MVNKKAVWTFLTITFGLTILLALAVRLSGLRIGDLPLALTQGVVGVAMFIPMIGAVVTQKFVLKKPLKGLGFKLGPLSLYGKAYLFICAIYIVNYAITWAFIQKPDLTLMSLIDQSKSLVAAGTPVVLPLPALTMIGLFSLLTFIGAPILNLIPSLGEEIGWRGFLLPALEPLGKTKATIYSGMIWALWHTPMILILGFMYGAEAWPGVILHFLLITSLGIWMGALWFRNRSSVFAAFVHAVFNANAYGVWVMIFVNNSKLVVGPAGAINVSLWILVAAVTLLLVKKSARPTGLVKSASI